MEKIVVLNGGVVNYDGRMDWQSLGDAVTVYDHSEPAEILARVQDATVIVTKEMPMSGEIVEQLPASVKMIVEAGTGYNNHDLQALAKKHIALTNIPAYSTERVAQTAVMLMLNLASTMQTQMAMLARGDHRNFSAHLMVNHVEINGKTLGVIGYGHIGRAVIKIAQSMGMHILVATRTKRQDVDGVHFTTLEELLGQSDVVSLHLPLNDATANMIDTAALASMKPTAFLINTARGGLIDEAALVDALKNHVIAGAGLDVQAHEPLADDSPLFDLNNVILTPHIGWRGLETRQRLVRMVAENIAAYLAGTPINQVN